MALYLYILSGVVFEAFEILDSFFTLVKTKVVVLFVEHIRPFGPSAIFTNCLNITMLVLVSPAVVKMVNILLRLS